MLLGVFSITIVARCVAFQKVAGELSSVLVLRKERDLLTPFQRFCRKSYNRRAFHECLTHSRSVTLMSNNGRVSILLDFNG